MNTQPRILDDVTAMQALVDKLQAELKAAKAQAKATIRLQVSEKGGVSIYGLQRFPVTLYAEQLLKLLEMKDTIEAFIIDNAETLKTKAPK